MHLLLRIAGWTVIALGVVVGLVLGLMSLSLSFSIVADTLGGGWAIAGFFFFPIFLTVAPLYAGFFQGDWTAFWVTLAGAVAFWLAGGLGLVLLEAGSKPQPTLVSRPFTKDL